MDFLKCITTKGEVVWLNICVVYYITPYKNYYRCYFEDGMTVDVAEFTEVTLQDFLHSLSQN